MSRPIDTRTIGSRIAGGIAAAVRRSLDLLGLVVLLAIVLSVPIGSFYVILHFVRRYW